MTQRHKRKNSERRTRSRKAKRISNKMKKLEGDIQDKTQTTLRNKQENKTKIHRRNCKRIVEWLRHTLDREGRPRRFEKKIDKEIHTYE